LSEIQFANTKSPGKWRGKQFLGDDGADPFGGGGGERRVASAASKFALPALPR
jgi:hypothetical protein